MAASLQFISDWLLCLCYISSEGCASERFAHAGVWSQGQKSNGGWGNMALRIRLLCAVQCESLLRDLGEPIGSRNKARAGLGEFSGICCPVVGGSRGRAGELPLQT